MTRGRFPLPNVIGRSREWNGLKTSEGFDSSKVEAGEHPGKSVPAKTGDGRSSDERRKKPEAGPAPRPNISHAEQASGDGARIDRKRRGERLRRNRLRRRGGRSLQSALRSKGRRKGQENLTFPVRDRSFYSSEIVRRLNSTRGSTKLE